MISCEASLYTEMQLRHPHFLLPLHHKIQLYLTTALLHQHDGVQTVLQNSLQNLIKKAASFVQPSISFHFTEFHCCVKGGGGDKL